MSGPLLIHRPDSTGSQPLPPQVGNPTDTGKPGTAHWFSSAQPACDRWNTDELVVTPTR